LKVSKRILIVGASARAAAQSALRSGFLPVCGDLFGDADLQALCQVTIVRDYPAGFQKLFESRQFDAWMFTGALENHPSLLHQWSSRWAHLGTSIESIRRVRNPLALSDALRRAGFHAPKVARSIGQLDSSRAYLRKPLKSAGGTNIRLVRSNEDAAENQGCYYQEFVPGTPYGGLYVAASGAVQLLGVTRSLIGTAWCGADGFRYGGSLGPVRLSGSLKREWTGIGESLAREFGLTGLFGIDAVLNEQGVWLVEVNPRYTASVEILERADAGCRTIARHVLACRESRIMPPSQPSDDTMHGKAVLYAESDGVVTADDTDKLLSWSRQDAYPIVADVPKPGKIRARQPILTVFAHHKDEQQLLDALRARADQVRRLLRLDAADVRAKSPR
jgi:predicted ATP-grasp superfamily ATP-dependent carboligase